MKLTVKLLFIFSFILFYSFIVHPEKKTVDLVTKSLLNGKVEIKMPKDFLPMDKEMISYKYPAENRPQFIYTDSTTEINMAYNLTDNKASQQTIAPYENVMVKNFYKIFPTLVWKSHGVTTIGNKKVGYLELITTARDTDIYNLIFFTDVNGKLFVCSFNCTKRFINDWEATAHIIMNSLRVK